MFRHVCLTLLLVLGSGFVLAATPPTQHGNATTAAPTTHHGNATTAAPTTHHGNATTAAPTTHHGNATTAAPTTHHGNATTAAPTTHHGNATTAAPTTHHGNATTAAPTTPHTNATTVAPTTPTPSPLPQPVAGDYDLRVNASVNSTICLKAHLGLRISYKLENASFQSINIDPKSTTVNGTCGNGGSSATLVLTSSSITAVFIFTNVTNKFHLHSLDVTVNESSGIIFQALNDSLSLWEASVGSSYMCKKEQIDTILPNLTLHTFDLRIQPFGVENDKFSTAHECSMDDSSILIPIIVGAALAGLILVVVIAYVIGRRKTYVGYQTL